MGGVKVEPSQFLLLAERNPDMFKKGQRFGAILGGGYYGYCQAEDIAQILIGGFWKNRVFFNADSDIAHFVNRFGRNAAEVLSAGQGDI